MSKYNITEHRIAKLKHPPLSIGHPPQRRFRIRHCIVAAILALMSCFHSPVVLAIQDASCSDVEFIFARGSGESLGSDTYRAWENSLRSELDEEPNLQSLTYHFYELGAQPQQGFQYPAVHISGDLEGIINLGGAAISAGEAYAFGESVADGMGELKTYINQITRTCPQTKFVLGGYSQGAMVLTRSLASLDANQIIYVATFGDPKLYLPEGSHSQNDDFYVPKACYGLDLSEYREYVPDCYAYAGILGPAIPYQPLGYSGKLGTWCNQDDIMCSSGSSIQDHVSYVKDQLYPDAARRIVQAIKDAFADRLDYDFEVEQHIHEVAIVADITGSMARGDLYWRLTREAEKLASKVIAAGGRVSYFTYRDLIDGTETKKLCDFTCTLAEFKDAVNGVKLISGEDDDESALSAMDYAINALNWSENSEKSLLILTDAGLLEPDRDGKTSADVIASSKAHGGVKIFAPVWKEYLDEYRAVAEQTGGQVLNLGDGIEKATAVILPSPLINLTKTSYEGPVGSHFVFDASASQVFVGPDLVYEWDLDGNGLYELKNAGPIVEKTFDRFSGEVFVRATDRAGHSTVASILVNTQGTLSPLPVTKITDVNVETSVADANADSAISPVSDTAKVVSVNFSTDADRVLLTMDDAILGFVELTNGQGSLIIKDAGDVSKLVLVPYSSTGRRGNGYEVSISNESQQVPEPNTETVSPAASQSGAPSSNDSVIPKAPNTGVRSQNKKEAIMLKP